MNQIQTQIYKALEELKDKSTFTEFDLAKKVRKDNNIYGKQKAGICMADLEIVMETLNKEKGICFSLHVNSANDLLIKKAEIYVPVIAETKKRRLSSEKSMQILTNSDFGKSSKEKKPSHQSKRTERKRMDIYADYGEE